MHTLPDDDEKRYKKREIAAISRLGRAALGYATRLGWAVLPLAPQSKVPHPRLAPHGHRDATTDTARIEAWWRAAPDAGIAVACAASGLVVIDVDAYKDACEMPRLERELGPLPHTPRQITPRGGVHYVFRAEPGAKYRNPCAGAEAKHEGYIVVAPSEHPDVPRRYTWDLGALPSETPIAPLPRPWARHLVVGAVGVQRPAVGPAAESLLGAAFGALGWLGAPLPNGAAMARCPWHATHTDGRGDGHDSSCVVLPPTSTLGLGRYWCSHEHCQRPPRTIGEVVRALGPVAMSAASRVRPDAYAHVVRLLAREATR